MGEKRNNAAVSLGASAKFLYGYRTSSTDQASTLGIVALVEGTAPAKDVAFSPKNFGPTSASKKGISAKGGICDEIKVAALKTAGYQISRKNAQNPSGTLKSVIVAVKMTASMYLLWRMKKSAWTALPAAVKTAAGITLATDVPVDERAYHADGFIFKAADTVMNVTAGKYYSKKWFRKSYTVGDQSYRVYAGTERTAIEVTP